MLISQIYGISSSSFLMCPISSIFRVTYMFILSHLYMMQPDREYVKGLKCHCH